MRMINLYRKSIAAILFCSSLFTGCVENENIGTQDKMEPDCRMVQISASTGHEAAGTKSSYVTAATESKVYDMSVFIFDGSSLYYSGYSSNSGNMTIPMYAGKTYSAHVFVNMGDLRSEIGSIDQLRDYKYSVTATNMTGSLPMYGRSDLSVTASTQDASIPVQRLVGRYELRISKANLSDGVSLKVNSVRVRNMASSICPFSSEYVATGTVSDGDCSSSEDIASLNAGGAVLYYVAENLQGREPGIKDPRDKIPTYAFSNVNPDKATYLEIKGCFRKEGNDIDVTYRFFLGGNSTDDFNIRRNTNYIVTLAPYDLNNGNDWWKCEKDGPDPGSDPLYISVYLNPSSITVGGMSEVTVNAHYSDGTIADVTDMATKSVANPNIATMNGRSLVGKAAGSSVISASYKGKSASAALTVQAAEVVTLDHISVSLRPYTIKVGGTSSVTVIAYYTNGTTGNVTSYAVKNSGNTAVATISGNILTGVSAGTSTISVSYAGQNDSAVLTVESDQTAPVDPVTPIDPDPVDPVDPEDPSDPVTPDVVTHALEITPGSQTVKAKKSVSYNATYYTITNGVRDGGIDVTGDASWYISSGGSYAISNGGGNYTGKDVGSAVVLATYGDLMATASLTVIQADYFRVSCPSSVSISATYYSVHNGSHLEHSTERTTSRIAVLMSKNMSTYEDVTDRCTFIITSGATYFSVSPSGVVSSDLNPTAYLNCPATGSFNSTSKTGSVKVWYTDEDGTVYTNDVSITVNLFYDNGSSGLRN